MGLKRWGQMTIICLRDRKIEFGLCDGATMQNPFYCSFIERSPSRLTPST
jgi:hypothetical protein